MKINGQLIRKPRKFSKEFKISIVNDYESGKFSVKQISKMHNIAPTQIYDWIYKYSFYNEKGFRIVEKSKSSSEKLKEYEKRIAELERALGNKQIQLDFLEKLVEIAEEDLGVQIKKNINTPHSGGSEKTKKK